MKQILRALALALVAGVLPAQQGATPTAIIGGADNRGITLEDPRVVTVIGDRILVINRQPPFVMLFSFDGKLRQRFGTKGAGPAEFTGPQVAVFDSASRRLLIFDQGLGRATAFRVGDTLRLEKTLSAGFRVNAACYAGKRLFIAGFANGHIVHELTESQYQLTVARSLGTVPANHPLAKNPLFQGLYMQGPLLCDAGAQRLLAVSRNGGVVQIVPLAGSAEQTIALTSFRPVVYSLKDGGLAQTMPEDLVVDQVLGIGSGMAGVRIFVGRTDADRRTDGEFASYREIDLARDGRQTEGRPSQWLQIDSRPTRSVCYQGSPYPAIAVFASPRCP
jgi:hypothetical protein